VLGWHATSVWLVLSTDRAPSKHHARLPDGMH